jgi:hypothetical protein
MTTPDSDDERGVQRRLSPSTTERKAETYSDSTGNRIHVPPSLIHGAPVVTSPRHEWQVFNTALNMFSSVLNLDFLDHSEYSGTWGAEGPQEFSTCEPIATVKTEHYGKDRLLICNCRTVHE